MIDRRAACGGSRIDWSLRRSAALLATAATALSAACASSPDPHAGLEERIARAREGLDSPAVEARQAEVEASLHREKSDPLVDRLEFRVRGRHDEAGDDLRLLGRLPIENPFVSRSVLAERRAATEAAVARLEETALEQRADLCAQAVVAEVGFRESALYAEYARRQHDVLVWNEQRRGLGAIDELSAASFELTQRTKLATRLPRPAKTSGTEAGGLPSLDAPSGRLVRTPEAIHRLVRARHPAVEVHLATAKRFDKRSERERATRLPSVRFLEVSYEPVNTGPDDNQVGAQIAVNIPFGQGAKAQAERYGALGASEVSAGRSETLRRSEDAAAALADLDHYESNLPRWRLLVELAGEVTMAADERLAQQIARPPQVADLFEDAYEVHASVLREREEAGRARCRLLEASGVPLEEWPRE